MKNIVLLLIQICLQNVLIGQNYVNKKYIFSTDFAAGGFQGILTKNDTLITSGIIVEWENINQRKGFFAKMDMEGNILNFQLVDTSNVNYFWILPRAICKLKDKGYLATGTYDNAEYMNCFLAKVDENLDTVWVKKIHHTDSSKQLLGRSIIELSNGNIYLFCEVWQYQGSVGVVDNNTMLILLDAQGNEISRREWGVGYTRELPKGLLNTPWGLLAYGGNAWLTSNLNNNGGYILGLDTACNIESVYICPKADSVIWINSLALTSDSNLIACGIMTRQNPVSQDWSCFDYIAKYSPPPYQQLWQIRFQSSDCEYSQLCKVVATPDGGAAVCGNDDGIKSKGWLMKVSANGEIEWDRRHTLIGGGDHYFSDMVRNTDGGFTLAGYIYAHDPMDVIGTYAWLARTDSFGCLVPGCQSVGIAENTPIESSFKLYPNPASDRLFLYYHNPQLQNCVFAVRDLAGRQLVPPTPLENSTTYEMRIGDWAKGLYFVEVRDAEGNVFTEKFVKE